MGVSIINVDLHGMFQDEAIKVIDQTLRNADDSTYQIRLIHQAIGACPPPLIL